MCVSPHTQQPFNYHKEEKDITLISFWANSVSPIQGTNSGINLSLNIYITLTCVLIQLLAGI